jgi:hypothetical protein
MSNLDLSVNDVLKMTPMGPIDTAIGNVFYGINHRQTPSAVPINKDLFGLTFFTRPQLNLSTQNTRAERKFISLLTQEEASIQRIIRCYLDPRLNQKISCPFVDKQNAFMPLLTNHLLSISGWPDIVLDTFTSKPGAYKEVYSFTDSTSDIFSAYDITATFRNMVADPITLLFLVWCTYQSNVFQGTMVPYPDFLIKNEIDYNTRIYRLVLDSTKRYVQKIGCTGAAYPTAVPIGASFNYEHDKPVNMSNQDIQINFRCLGARYQDDIIIHNFNTVVGIFNPSMKDSYYASSMQKIPFETLQVFNGKGYPRIDPNTYELEWYVFKDEYERVMVIYEKHLESILKQSTPEPPSNTNQVNFGLPEIKKPKAMDIAKKIKTLSI